jgi:hypothetical protein
MDHVSERALTEGVARTPSDHHVIWLGHLAKGRDESACSVTLGLIERPWDPVPLRSLLLRAARLDGSQGIPPDLARAAVRQHQSARPACYLLVRRTIAGDFVTVTDVPWPATAGAPLRTGDLVLAAEKAELPRVVGLRAFV